MLFFNQLKPRHFHHDYIYVDERKEKLEKLRQKAKQELGLRGDDVTTMRTESHCSDVFFHFRRRNREKSSMRMLLSVGVSAIFALSLMFLLLFLI
ncbi:UNVERIFIED_CONTAM: hypothetical protein NY100_08115 [Prevotella sp. 15_C9]